MNNNSKNRIAWQFCMVLLVLLNAAMLFAQPTPPFWWDNPIGMPADRWHQVETSGTVENNGQQAQFVRAVIDVPNVFNEQLSKRIWVQVEWLMERGEGGLLTEPETHTIQWLNSEQMCPASPLESYPTPDGSGYLIAVAPYTPVTPTFENGQGMELSFDPISPQPASERLELFFQVGPDARLLYSVKVQTICFELDFGDAPDPDYPTLLPAGANHVIVPGLHLGTQIDADGEGDGLPGALADGDDLDNVDDEDGLADPTQLQLVQGAIPKIDLNVTAPDNIVVTVSGWIDLDGSGTWEAGEGTSVQRSGSGPVSLTFPTVPCDAPAQTFARFRLSSDAEAVAEPGGFALDGEVEDYVVHIAGLDLGDAPDDPENNSDYPTLLASNGAVHVIVPGLALGSEIDSEKDGQPTAQADGDDVNGSINDEDGVDPLQLKAQVGSQPSITVSVTAPENETVTVTGWIDTDASHIWELAESASATRIGSGTVVLDFPTVIPNSYELTGGQTFARFRLALGDQPVEPSGAIANGEVEDYTFQILPPDEFDFGDMPENLFPGFITLDASGGAKHILREGVYLGFGVDADDDGQPSDAADGDDNDGTDDEDGVVFPPLPLVQGTTVNFQVLASVDGYLNAWIDWNGDGDWDDDGDHFLVDEPLTAGDNLVPVVVPITKETNIAAYTRFRFTTAEGLDSYGGVAADGEVEDYLIDVVYPIELSSFSGIVTENTVRLEWVTQSETQNLGFQVFRSFTSDGEYKQITSSLISGAGNSQSSHTYSHVDTDVELGQTYYYKLADISYTGMMNLHGPIEVTLAPGQYILQQNYPNPFNPETTISFMMKEQGQADLSIFNLRGQLVRNLTSRVYAVGTHQVVWDGKDNNGNVLPSGVYIYKLKTANFEQSKRMEYIK